MDRSVQQSMKKKKKREREREREKMRRPVHIRRPHPSASKLWRNRWLVSVSSVVASRFAFHRLTEAFLVAIQCVCVCVCVTMMASDPNRATHTSGGPPSAGAKAIARNLARFLRPASLDRRLEIGASHHRHIGDNRAVN